MKVSDCCGAQITLDMEDTGICPDCKEHCEYEVIEEKEDELTLTLNYNEKKDEEYVAIMGGMDTNPTWEEYIKDLDDDYKPHFELIKKAILNEENKLYKITGEQKQNKSVSFKFSDGKHFGFSWRGWGDLMQAIVGEREGYMTYYM